MGQNVLAIAEECALSERDFPSSEVPVNTGIGISGTTKPLARTARVRVLLVDENVKDLTFFQHLLEKHGLEVYGCTSHQKALESLEHGTFDFIVVSQGSRAFEGRCVLARAIELNRRTPVLIVTDSVDMGCYLEAMQLGAIDYLEKPLRGPEFLDTVRSHLSSRRSPL